MKYEEQERKIYAKYDDKTIRVYQAYNNKIADEAKEKVKNSLVRCQWDPERDIYGKPIGRRSIQLGIRGEAVVKYVNEWIVKITDITDEVKRIKQSIDNGTFKESFLPEEKEYIVK